MIGSDNTKACTRCQERKPLAEFGRYAKTPDGLQPWCLDCWHKYDKARRKTASYQAKKREYADRNLAKESARNRLRYKDDPAFRTRVSRATAKYNSSDNGKKKNLARQQTEAYRARHRAASRQLSKTEARRLYMRAYTNKRRAREIEAGGGYTRDDISQIYTAQKAKCAICRKSLRSEFHADHIIPLVRGGSNYRSNIQLLCKTCNLRKSAKDPIDFMRSLGWLL